MRRRAGMGSLVTALGLLIVMGIVAAFHFGVSRQAMSQVQRNHLTTLARLQARSGLEELLDQVSKDANDPEAPLFRYLREQLNGTWTQLNLRPFLRKPAIQIRPSWGRFIEGQPENKSPVEGRVVDYLALIRAPTRSTDPLGTEELVAILTLTVIADAISPQGAVRRLVSATHELRICLTHPPRPFDQMAMYLGDVRALLDVPRANQLRQETFAAHEALRQELAAAGAERGGAVGTRLTQLANSLTTPDVLRDNIPAIPTQPGTPIFGPYHAQDPSPAGSFDLVRQAEEARVRRLEADAAYRAARAGPDAGRAAYRLVSAMGQELSVFSGYQVAMTILDPDGTRFTEQFRPTLARLDPGYFLDRAHLRLDADSELFQRWAEGDARVHGIADLDTGGRGVRIENPTLGRLILIVRGGAVTLGNTAEPDDDLSEDHARPTPDNRLVLVSLGADVSVEGRARAAVMMLRGADGSPPGRFRVSPGARLEGALTVPDPLAGGVELAGEIQYDPTLATPFPPSRTLESPGPGHYVVVVSPAPVFQAGLR